MKKTLCVALGFGLLLAWGCGNQQAVKEKKAERAYYVTSRDLEEKLATLPKAIQSYAEIAAKYPSTTAGKKAEARHSALMTAQKLYAGVKSAPNDSLTAVYKRICEVAPGYPPAVRELGKIYYNHTYLTSRSAAMTHYPTLEKSVLEVWAAQDSLWSHYAFRPDPSDREWRDRLCRQAVDVARMLEAFKHYEQALKVVDRGLHYGVGDDVVAHARVFASFYTFRMGRFQAGIRLANQALSYTYLPKEDKARAYHVMGLCYTYLQRKDGKVSTLDQAIKALNQAVVIDPSMEQARELLKNLRIERQKLTS